MLQDWLEKIVEQEHLNQMLISQIQEGRLSGDLDPSRKYLSEEIYTLQRLEKIMGVEQRLQQLTEEKVKEMRREVEEIMAGEHSRERYHCSEAFLLVVGSYLFGGVDEQIRRMTTGLAGGVGGTHHEMCGALVGGILCIGKMYGRARPTEDDQPAYRLSVSYRDQFIEKLGGAKCHELRELGYGSDSPQPCGVLVGKAIPVFFETLKDRAQLFDDQE